MPNSILENALVQIINQVTTGVDTSINFLSAQIPDIIHQLLLWKLVSNLMWTSLEFLATVVSITATIKLFKIGVNYQPKTPYDTEAENYFLASGGCTVLSAVCIMLTLIDFSVVLQIWLAPKLYLIEYTRALLK